MDTMFSMQDAMNRGGKGGWDSGEIETPKRSCISYELLIEVERADGTQARLKQHDNDAVFTHLDTMVERADGTQARLKQHR